eukprot:GFYU01002511.1.p1 GENE.GFYU01002511.1~~GFYU01002511.1.p1  ORF type:complete len:314 (-),score=73.40 GFYU01002511.1:128-1069(-)
MMSVVEFKAYFSWVVGNFLLISVCGLVCHGVWSTLKVWFVSQRNISKVSSKAEAYREDSQTNAEKRQLEMEYNAERNFKLKRATENWERVLPFFFHEKAEEVSKTTDPQAMQVGRFLNHVRAVLPPEASDRFRSLVFDQRRGKVTFKAYLRKCVDIVIMAVKETVAGRGQGRTTVATVWDLLTWFTLVLPPHRKNRAMLFEMAEDARERFTEEFDAKESAMPLFFCPTALATLLKHGECHDIALRYNAVMALWALAQLPDSDEKFDLLDELGDADGYSALEVTSMCDVECVQSTPELKKLARAAKNALEALPR